MDKHTHHSCEHEVAWCRHCDVAYCKNCDITWTRGPRWTLQSGTQYVNANAAVAVPIPLTVPTTMPAGPARYGDPAIHPGFQVTCNHTN